MNLIENNSKGTELQDNSPSILQARKRSSLNWVNKLGQRKKSNIRKSQINIEKEISVEDMITKAQIHCKANRPLIKIKEFDGGTKFCQCCYLPAEDNTYLRTFNFCENTDKFADYGRGTSLFFSYYRFSTLILAFTLCLVALPSFFINSFIL